MTTNNLINTLVAVERILCVYRNYSILEKRVYIVKLRIFFELACICFAYSIFVVNSISLFSKGESIFQFMISFCYVSLMVLNSVLAIGLACYNSKYFVDFVSNLEAIHRMYENELLYQNSMKRRHSQFYVHLSVVVALNLPITATQAYDILNGDKSLHDIVFFIVQLTFVLRYFYQNLFFYELIECIMVPLSMLESKICISARELLEGGEEVTSVVYWPGVRMGVRRWGEEYRHLAAAARNISDHFSVQMTLSVFSNMFYFISLMYQVTSYVISLNLSEIDFRLISSLCLMMCACALSALLAARAGQRVLNKAEQLERNLAVFYSVLIQIPDVSVASCARTAGALCRELRAAPLRVRLLAARALRAALLAEMAAIVVNHTVVLLQFNHVV